jgi:hypothetical protein
MPAPSDRPADRTPRADRAVPRLATSADAAPDLQPGDAVRRRRALDRVAESLAAVPLSLEAVRAAAVRFGDAARDAGLAPDEMAAALAAQVRRSATRRGASDPARLGASVAWWGAHGYHRAD